MSEIIKEQQHNTTEANQSLTYDYLENHNCSLLITNLTVNKGIKNWDFSCKSPTIVALFGNEEENLNNILKSLSGVEYLVNGQILVNKVDVTYNYTGWERNMVYVPLRLENWNKLFTIQHNLGRYGLNNKAFLEEISAFNKKIKTDIANLKNTGINLDMHDFKNNILKLIKNFISETEVTRNLFIKEYESQINSFHEEFAKNRFNFSGSEELTPILVRKFNAEEENIIANNNLLFFQSLQDRISSLENLVGECSCGCVVPKKRKKEFQLKEILFVVAEANNLINRQIFKARKEIKRTLKSCNNHNQIFNITLNRTFAYNKLSISRNEIDHLIEEWVDLAEVQRIKFNMKQDFIAMQVLPDEMHLLLKNIKDEVKIYHEKLLNNPRLDNKKNYLQKINDLENELIDVRDLISKNIFYIFEILELTSLLSKRYSQLSRLERRIVLIIQKLVIVTKIVLIENPFQLIEKTDQKQLAIWIKKLAESLKIIIIFTSKNKENISLLASEIAIIENELIVQQGKIEGVINKPLSLSFLKEIAPKHLNVLETKLENGNVIFYQNKIASFSNIKDCPLVAIKGSDITFVTKKPLFTFLYKIMKINGTTKNISNFNQSQLILTFESVNNDLFEVVVDNAFKYPVGTNGWIIISKDTVYIFDAVSRQLVGTW